MTDEQWLADLNMPAPGRTELDDWIADNMSVIRRRFPESVFPCYGNGMYLVCVNVMERMGSVIIGSVVTTLDGAIVKDTLTNESRNVSSVDKLHAALCQLLSAYPSKLRRNLVPPATHSATPQSLGSNGPVVEHDATEHLTRSTG